MHRVVIVGKAFRNSIEAIEARTNGGRCDAERHRPS
jgi:hypothetical protein